MPPIHDTVSPGKLAGRQFLPEPFFPGKPDKKPKNREIDVFQPSFNQVSTKFQPTLNHAMNQKFLENRKGHFYPTFIQYLPNNQSSGIAHVISEQASSQSPLLPRSP